MIWGWNLSQHVRVAWDPEELFIELLVLQTDKQRHREEGAATQASPVLSNHTMPSHALVLISNGALRTVAVSFEISLLSSSF